MTVMHELPAETPAQRQAAAAPWWQMSEFWGTVAIVAMWLAVLFVGVYGADMTFTSEPTNTSTIPSGVAVALFAALGTTAVARRVYRR